MPRDTAWESEYADYFAVRSVPLRRLAFGLSGDWHLADDLVQHTFLQLYKHWRRVDPARVDAYTRKALVNAFLSYRRRGRREHVMPDVPDQIAAPASEEAPDATIMSALAELPPRQRAMVVLRYLEDLSVAQVAEMLGIPEGTVKSQSSRGLDKLRAALGQPASREISHG